MVYPQVSADFATTDTIGCSPLRVSFTRLSNSGNKISWDFGDGNISMVANPTHTFTNTTGKDTVFTVRLIVESPTCVDTAYQEITVYGVPQVSYTSVTAGCSPLEVDFTNTSSGAVKYTWNFGDGIIIDTNQNNIKHSFFNFGSSNKPYTVTLTGENAGGCRSVYSSEITVYPMVSAEITASDTAGCTPYQVRFYNSSVPGVTYNYDFGDGTSYTGSNPTHTFVNTLLKDTLYQVRMIAQSATCADTSYQIIRVYGKPVADFTLTDKGCSPVVATFTNLSQGATAYYWNFGDGSSSDTTAMTFTRIMNNPGLSNRTYSVTLIAENDHGCSAVVSKDILVYPKVTADYVLSDTAGCNPLKVTIQNYSFAATTYSWDFGNGTISDLANPVITFTNSSLVDSVYTIRLIASSEHCRDTLEKKVTVHPSPKVNIAPDVNEGCSPLSVTVVNATQGATAYSWDFGDGTLIDTIHADLQHVYINTGFSSRTFRINLLAENDFGCQARTESNIIVYPEVIAEFAVNDTVSCTPANIQLTNTSLGAKNYSWDFGNGTGSGLFSPSVTLHNSGTIDSVYTIRLIASSATCTDTTYKNIRVHPAPKPSFDLPQAGCGPLNAEIHNTTSGAVRYVWDLGTGDIVDTTSSAPFNYVFSNNGISNRNYTVWLEAINSFGCSASLNKTVTVYPEVTADILASDTVGCTPINVKFNKNSLAATEFNWSFGDGESANGSAVEHLFSNPVLTDTVYKVTLVAKSSTCADTAYKYITVYPAPKASFELPASGCSPYPAIIKNTTEGAVNYLWDFGNGATSDTLAGTFEHLYYNLNSSPRNYLVRLTATSTNGCSSTFNKSIIIYPEVKADFIRDTIGCSPFNAAIQNRSQGAASYVWDFGDGTPKSTVASPYHLYETATDKIFHLTLIASSDNCSDTISKTVKVLATPSAKFTATPTSFTLPDSVVTISNLTSPGPWSYLWTFGDGDTSYVPEPGKHYYDFYGNYSITLKVTNANCSSEYSQMIAVYPTAPVADFVGEGDGCSPLLVQFENKSKYADTLIWDFGDGDKLVLSRPFPKYITHTFLNPDKYSVKLTAIGKGGSDQIVKDTIVKVRNVPYASFSVKPREAVIPDDAHYFSNQSKDADSFEWDFGDGHTSTQRSPFHTYEKPGEYDVRLIAHNRYGCSDTFFVKAAALAVAGGLIKVPNAFTPSSAGPNGGHINSGGLNDVFYPLTDNVVDFHMMIFNRWGELLFESKTVNIGWDGYYRGELCPEDVYVYKIRATLSGGEVKELVGDVTLIRE
ncbi:MAG TPA: PKD domain-containing protein [Cytophagaceae bacterium]